MDGAASPILGKEVDHTWYYATVVTAWYMLLGGEYHTDAGVPICTVLDFCMLTPERSFASHTDSCSWTSTYLKWLALARFDPNLGGNPAL
jgi:hypothetical protein